MNWGRLRPCVTENLTGSPGWIASSDVPGQQCVGSDQNERTPYPVGGIRVGVRTSRLHGLKTAWKSQCTVESGRIEVARLFKELEMTGASVVEQVGVPNLFFPPGSAEKKENSICGMGS